MKDNAIAGPAAGRPCMSTPERLPCWRKLATRTHPCRAHPALASKLSAARRAPRQQEDPRADDPADAERGEAPAAEGFLQPLRGHLGVGDQLIDRLAGVGL